MTVRTRRAASAERGLISHLKGSGGLTDENASSVIHTIFQKKIIYLMSVLVCAATGTIGVPFSSLAWRMSNAARTLATQMKMVASAI